MRFIVLPILTLSVFAASGSGQAKQPNSASDVAFPQRLSADDRFLDTYARVGENLLISGQPTDQALRDLRRSGVTTVINLRSPSEMARLPFDEKALVAQLGMRYVYLPMRGDADYPFAPAAVATLARVLDETKGEKVLLHCTVAWRASHLWAAYLIRYKGLSDAEALSHMRAIHHHAREGDRTPLESFLGRTVKGIR